MSGPRHDDPYLPPQKLENPDLVKSSSCIRTLLICFMPSIIIPLILVFLASVWPLAVLIAIGFLSFSLS